MQDRRHIRKFLFPAMMTLSLILGLFIAYYFTYVNGLFVKKVGSKYLGLAFIVSGLIGLGITFMYNSVEKKHGFFKTSAIFNLIFAGCIGLIFILRLKGLHEWYVIFIAYTLFWFSSNYLNLIFWKIPSNFFDIGENKQYNGLISTGEVVAGIVAYMTIPILKLEGNSLLLISVFGMLGFFAIFQFIRIRLTKLQVNMPVPRKESAKGGVAVKVEVWKSQFTRFIFWAIFFSIMVQLIVDFALLESAAKSFDGQKEVTSYLAQVYMGMRIVELFMKTLVSRYIIKEMGVFIGLISIILVLGIFVVGGIVSMVSSVAGAVLFFASINKVFERSVFRAIYVPTVNILYQAYPVSSRSISQNFADGYGKTLGQILAGTLIIILSYFVPAFEMKMQIVFISIFLMLLIWFLVSRKLILQYRVELNDLIIRLRENISEDKVVKKTMTPLNDDASVPGLAELSKRMTGSTSLALSELTDKVEAGRRLDAFNSYVSHHMTFSASEPFSRDEITIICHAYRFAEAHDMVAGSVKFQVNMLGYAPCRSFAAATLESLPFDEIQRGLIFISDTINRTRSAGMLDLLKRMYVSQLYFEKLPEAKKTNEVKALCRYERDLFCSIVNDSDFHLDRNELYPAYIQLLQKSISNFSYVIACMRDMRDESPLLRRMLECERLQCTQDIIRILRSVNEKDVFDRIIPMIFRGSRSEEVLAYELLELVLSEQEKNWVMPVVREVRYTSIIQKLEMDFPQIPLNVDERLLSIIGRNVTRLSELTRLAAFRCWVSRNPVDKVSSVANGLAFSSEPFMREAACKYLQDRPGPVHDDLLLRSAFDTARSHDHADLVDRLALLLEDPKGIMPVTIIDLFVRCLAEDPSFTQADNNLLGLARKVYRGRTEDFDAAVGIFYKHFGDRVGAARLAHAV
jgi:hypothetical protein